MTTSNLTFNMLTFNHPSEEYTFYFYKDERENLKRVHKTLVPEEVIEEFGQQDHYYTSFAEEKEGALSISKLMTTHCLCASLSKFRLPELPINPNCLFHSKEDQNCLKGALKP